jgi:hypothetical protein
VAVLIGLVAARVYVWGVGRGLEMESTREALQRTVIILGTVLAGALLLVLPAVSMIIDEVCSDRCLGQ